MAQSQKYAEKQIRKDIDKNVGLAIGLKLMQFDPFTDLHAITLAVILNKEKPDGLVIVRGKFDRERLQGVLDQFVKSLLDKAAVSEHGKIKIYQSKEGEQPGYGEFLDGETMVLSGNKSLIENAIDQSQGKLKPKLQKDLTVLLNKVDAKQTAWMVIAATERIKESVRQNPDGKAIADKLKGASASLAVTDGLLLDLALFTTDAEAVKAGQDGLAEGKKALEAAADSFGGYGPILLEVLKGVTVRTEGGTLTLRSEINGETIEKLIKKAQ